jgi:predicted small metal-binding protein
MARRWTCVEAGCDWAVVAPDDETIIALVQQHMEHAHSSFELEDMIEAVLEDVPDDGDEVGSFR